MENLFLILGWPGPIGVGIFLVCLGAFIWLLAKANEISKRVSKKEEEKKKE